MLRYFPVPLLLLCCANVVAAQSPDPRGSNQPGFSLSVGLVGVELDLLEDADQLFRTAEPGLQADSFGSGGKLELGYSFGYDFALKLRAVGSDHSTGDPATHLAFGQLELDAVAYLHSRGALRPYIAGGFGAAALALEHDDGQEDVLQGGSIDFGGGLDVYLSRRWSLGLDYRFGLQNYEREVLDGDSDEERDVDLASHSHRWSMSAGFSF